MKNQTLARIAAAGGFFVLGSGALFKWKIESGLKKAEYFTKALEVIRSSEAAKTTFGEPIRLGGIDLGDNANNYCDGLRAKFNVPLRGPKASGMLLLEAHRDTHGATWKLGDLEITLDKDKTRKLVLKSSSTKDA